MAIYGCWIVSHFATLMVAMTSYYELFYLNFSIRNIKEFTYKDLILAFVDFAYDCDFCSEVFGQIGYVEKLHVVFDEFIE